MPSSQKLGSPPWENNCLGCPCYPLAWEEAFLLHTSFRLGTHRACGVLSDPWGRTFHCYYYHFL